MRTPAPMLRALLIVLSTLLLLCACQPAAPTPPDNPNPDKEDPAMPTTTSFPIAPVEGAFSYTVLRHESSSEAERNALIAVRSVLTDVYGAAPQPETTMATDTLSAEELAARPELLVGKTGRPESEQVFAALGEDEFTVRVVASKLVVLGKTDDLTLRAVELLRTLLASAPQTLAGDFARTDAYTPGTYTGSYDFAALGYEQLTDVRFELREGEVVDGSAAEILYLTSDTHHYTYGYYSNNAWVDRGILIAARSASQDPVKFGASELVAVDVDDEKVWSLGITAKTYSDFVVDSELVYYLTGEELRCFNLLSRTEHTVISMPGMSFPHITANGSHINVSRHVGGLDTGTVIDTRTGETYNIMEIRFDEPYPIANHHMICPTNPEMMFFSHEGTTQHIPDRLWIAELGKEPYNIAYQKTDSSGKPLDCFGHEHWAPDGEGLYFVKYSVSPSAPKGVCYVSLDDIENPEVLYSKYPYWHVCCSPDETYLASDTQSSGFSGVCLINLETDEEILLYRAQTYNYQHPGHPHPCFSTDSSVLCFNDHNTENGKIAIGFYLIP